MRCVITPLLVTPSSIHAFHYGKYSKEVPSGLRIFWTVLCLGMTIGGLIWSRDLWKGYRKQLAKSRAVTADKTK